MAALYPDLARFRLLVDTVQKTQGDERTAYAEEINALLIGMRLQGKDDEEASTVLDALDLSLLKDLSDTQGRKCRVVAVETLIAMGFPHAMTVPPDDLTFANVSLKERLVAVCPNCEWVADGKKHWDCNDGQGKGCHKPLDTFFSRGICLHCGLKFENTTCPKCHQWAPHKGWYRPVESL